MPLHRYISYLYNLDTIIKFCVQMNVMSECNIILCIFS